MSSMGNNNKESKEHVVVLRVIGGQRLIGGTKLPPDQWRKGVAGWLSLRHPAYLEIAMRPGQSKVDMALLPVIDLDALARQEYLDFPADKVLLAAAANDTAAELWRKMAADLDRGPSSVIVPRMAR